MLQSFFNNMINFLIRDLDWSLRITISILLFLSGLFFLIWSIKKKNDLKPFAWGWLVLFFIALSLSVVYVTL